MKSKKDAKRGPPPADQPSGGDRPADRPTGDQPPPRPAPTEEAPQQPADAQAERDDLLARLQRVSADYLNYQKRAQRDIAQAREFANDQLIKALLEVLDDMERALEAARANHDTDDPLLTGMQLVHDNALRTLGRFGLKAIEAEGRPFDPDRHRAMVQQPSAEHPPQTVLKELQKGYELKGRTLRPAGVVISTEPPDEADPAPDEPAP
jgi:molecular chaperone GrpE